MKKISEIAAPVTPQKVANAIDAPVAMDKPGYWYGYEERPSIRGSWWVNGGATHSLDCLDIQWEGDWQDSLHEPEPEILPGPDGEEPVIRAHLDTKRWYASGVEVYVESFDTRIQAIKAWNAVVRSLAEQEGRNVDQD